jgi:hypothetical protein
VNVVDLDFIGKPRRRALCDHFAMIELRPVTIPEAAQRELFGGQTT